MYVVATVNGYSMSPTLHDGDALLMDTKYKSLHKGDVIVLKTPKRYRMANTPYSIKRIVATEGDSIFTYDGILYVNSQPVNDSSVGGTYNVKQGVVPKGHVYVLGDNREHSCDSRNYGYVSRHKIRGKAIKELDKSHLNHTSKGYKPKTIKDAFNMVKSEVYRKWELED